MVSNMHTLVCVHVCACVTSPDEAAGVKGLLDLEEDVAFVLIICDKRERVVIDAGRRPYSAHQRPIERVCPVGVHAPVLLACMCSAR